jgi:aminoglycoside/choline kinase family phosphotransferase
MTRTTSRQVVTIETMQAIFQAWFPHAQCLPNLQPLAADASSRRYFRLQWPLSDPSSSDTYILMLCDPWPEATTPDFLAVGQHLRACGVHVPQVYGIAPRQGLICLQDYGDCSLAVYWQQSTRSDRLLWGKRAIDELVKMHTRGTQRDNPSCPAFQLAFDVPKLLSELQFFRQHAIEGLWQHHLTTAEHEALDTAFNPLCTVLASQPRYFCHRDYHGWNLMVLGNTIGVLDFQDARMGPQSYDLVSLLTDRGIPEILGSDSMAMLTDYYIQRMADETGQPIARQDFNEQFEYVAIQRALKAVGTFAYMVTTHQRQQYRPYIAPTLAYIKPLIERHEILHPLAASLRRYLP